MKTPITDLHCDLLSYLQDAPNGNALNKTDIGCSIPDLEKGNVKLQVMAIYTGTEKGSSGLGLKQSTTMEFLYLVMQKKIYTKQTLLYKLLLLKIVRVFARKMTLLKWALKT